MQYQRQIIATSHVDRHQDRMSRGALESLVEQINSQYIPVTVEHDPRNPPLGRIVQAELKELDDGELAVEAIVQFFEPGDKVEFDEDRSLPIRMPDGVQIIYDRSYSNEHDQMAIRDIAETVDGGSQEFVKKAIEPLSVLTIAVAVALGNFFGGFFEQVGADAWDLLKQKIKTLIQGRRDQGIDHLLSFQFYTKQDDDQLLVEIVLSNPDDDTIDAFFNSGIEDLDQFIPDLTEADVRLRKMVLDYSTGRFSVLYGVRRDAAPLFFKEE